MDEYLKIGEVYEWTKPKSAEGLRFKVINTRYVGVDDYGKRDNYPWRETDKTPLVYEVEYLNYQYPKNLRKTVKISHWFIFKHRDSLEKIC